MSSNSSPRRSIEVEYWIIDGEGRLTAPGPLVDLPGAEREFVEPLLELKTTPCESTEELQRELFGRIRDALNRADDLGKQLVPLGTPLNYGEINEFSCDRTRIQNEVVGDTFQYVRHCAGTHIHIEQQSGHEIDQLNTLIALDPAFALVNSARHFRGKEMGAGARSKCYRWLAYEGLQNQGQLWSYIDNRADWEDRLQTCYEGFRERAMNAGIEESTYEECFDPESSVWTPVQLREEFGTIEWRSPDTTFPTQIIQLADTLCRVAGDLQGYDVRISGGKGQISDSSIVLPEFNALTSYVETAVQEGLTDSLRAYLKRMGFNPKTYTPISARFVNERELDRESARQYRLDYADQLREDVRQAPPLTSSSA